MATYDEHEVRLMANKVLDGLCKLDEENRRNDEETGWQNIGPPADKVGGITNKVHVAYLAEYALIRLGYIERNSQNIKVRLTGPGRANCGRDIDIPESDIQKLRRLLGE
jgi:hypothetical protein